MDRTILIVDDSPYIVDGLVALLKRRGFATVACHGGEEALAALGSVTPDLILLDIMMEPMDGWETLERFKENPSFAGIPVLMFSAKKITAGEAAEHSLCIEDFVSKPVNPSQLLEAINRIFERRSAVKTEMEQAKERGIDPALIEEYAALTKSIEVDKNLLVVLKKSSGTHFPGREVPADEMEAINRLEGKISTDEKRLAEISGKIHPVI